MISVYLYVALLLLMIVLCIKAFFIGHRKAPGKIRIYNGVITLGLSLRYIALLVLFIVESMNYLYCAKYLVCLNLIVVPCTIALCLYIFMRVDGLKFDYFFILMALGVVLYGIVMSLCKVSIEIRNPFGYIMRFLFEDKIHLAYIAIVSIALIITIVGFGKANSKSSGIIMTMVSIMVILGELLLKLMGVSIVFNTLIAELMILLTLNMGLKTFK